MHVEPQNTFLKISKALEKGEWEDLYMCIAHLQIKLPTKMVSWVFFKWI